VQQSSAHPKGFDARLGVGLLACLIASLPFWPLRVLGGLGASHLILAAAIPLALARIVRKGSVGHRAGPIDLFLTLYLGLAVVSLIPNPTGLGFPALTKSVAYWTAFLSMGVLIHGAPADTIRKASVAGVSLGLILFFAAATFLIATGQAGLGSLSPNSIYWDLTFPVYRGLLTSAGGLEDVRSADVMRSAVGEVFALYGLIILISVRRVTLWGGTLLVLSAGFAWAVASRRAGLALLLGFGLLSIRWRRRAVGVQLLTLLGAIAMFAAIVPSYLGRFGDLGSTQRVTQFSEAMARIAESPFTGHGFASRVGQQYVHNIVIGSWYMLGIVGLVLATALVLFLLVQAIRAADRRWSDAGVLLLIPFLGVLVGSTVEGTFTIVGWVSILLWSSLAGEDVPGLRSSGASAVTERDPRPTTGRRS